MTVEFRESYLKQEKATFAYSNVVNLIAVYQLDTFSKNLRTKFALGDWLFKTVKLNKNAHHDKYRNHGCSIGINTCSQFPCQAVIVVKALLFLV